MRFGLERNGLVPNKDVTIIQLGDQTALFAGLTGGSVQSTLISPPRTSPLKKWATMFSVLREIDQSGFIDRLYKR